MRFHLSNYLFWWHKPMKHHDRDLFSLPPEPLPIHRRALTPPPPPENQRTESQLQSPLFNKLSLEIRLQIYQEVLAPQGNEFLHVTSTHKRLCSFRCTEEMENLQGWQHDCWWPVIGDGTLAGRRPSQGPHPEIISGLLCSCQKIYSEAIDILYTKNLINVRQTRTISEFPLVIVPYRLAMIRSLHLDTMLQYDWLEESYPGAWPKDVNEYWESACLVVKDQMLGLQTFRVSFGVKPGISPVTDETLVKLLRHLVAVRHVQKFLVEFYWLIDLDRVLERLEVPPEDLPFTIEVHEISFRAGKGW